MTETNPEAEALLEELGNAAKSIPYVALFSHDAPDQPRTLRDLFTVETLLGELDRIAASEPPGSRQRKQVASRSSDGEQAQPESPPEPSAQDETVRSPDERPASPTVTSSQKNETLTWRPFDLAEIKKLRQQGQSLIVDWTADW